MRSLLMIAGACLAVLTRDAVQLDAKASQGSRTSLLASLKIADYPGELYLPVARRVTSEVIIEGDPVEFVVHLANKDETDGEIVFGVNDFSRAVVWTARKDNAVMSLSPRILPQTHYDDRQQKATIEWKPRIPLAPFGYLEWTTAPLTLSAGHYLIGVIFQAADQQGRPAVENGVSFTVVPRTLDLEAEVARRAVMRDILRGSFDDARGGIARLLRVHPNSVAAYQMLGLIAESESRELVGNLSDDKRAEADLAYRRALALVRNDSDAIISETVSPEDRREIADGLARRSARMGGITRQPAGK